MAWILISIKSIYHKNIHYGVTVENGTCGNALTTQRDVKTLHNNKIIKN